MSRYVDRGEFLRLGVEGAAGAVLRSVFGSVPKSGDLIKKGDVGSWGKEVVVGDARNLVNLAASGEVGGCLVGQYAPSQFERGMVVWRERGDTWSYSRLEMRKSYRPYPISFGEDGQGALFVVSRSLWRDNPSSRVDLYVNRGEGWESNLLRIGSGNEYGDAFTFGFIPHIAVKDSKVLVYYSLDGTRILGNLSFDGGRTFEEVAITEQRKGQWGNVLGGTGSIRAAFDGDDICFAFTQPGDFTNGMVVGSGVFFTRTRNGDWRQFTDPRFVSFNDVSDDMHLQMMDAVRPTLFPDKYGNMIVEWVSGDHSRVLDRIWGNFSSDGGLTWREENARILSATYADNRSIGIGSIAGDVKIIHREADWHLYSSVVSVERGLVVMKDTERLSTKRTLGVVPVVVGRNGVAWVSEDNQIVSRKCRAVRLPF